MGTKNHKQINGNLVRTDKKFRHLKQHQKEQIQEWLYQEYRRLWLQKDYEPSKQRNTEIVTAVMEHIKNAGIWISEEEVRSYLYQKKNSHNLAVTIQIYGYLL